jgi:hypothetical protein
VTTNLAVPLVVSTAATYTGNWRSHVDPHVQRGQRLSLSAYAKQTNDRVWTVSATSLLSAIDSGRELTQFTTFLPSTLSTLIADVHRRAGQLTDLGHARVIECADPATAALIAHDRSLRPLCHPIGNKHLAVPLDQELKFRKALLKVGYVGPRQPMT